MDNVVHLTEESSLDLPVERVLREAGDMSTVVVIGLKDGKFALRSSQGDVAEVALHLAAAQKLLNDAMGSLI